MWLTWHDVISSTTLVITSHCGLRCLGCKWWDPNTPHLSTTTLTEWVVSGRFFEHYPKTHAYNIVGGDPLCYEHLPGLLTQLKSEGIMIRLWGPMVATADTLATLRPWVDEWVVYTPYPERTAYREHTGDDGMPDRYAWLAEQPPEMRLTVWAWCMPLSVSWLPDLHEKARELGARLLVTYDPRADWQAEEKDYIHRYDRLHGCLVIPVRRTHRWACPAVPMQALQSPVTMGIKWWHAHWKTQAHGWGLVG